MTSLEMAAAEDFVSCIYYGATAVHCATSASYNIAQPSCWRAIIRNKVGFKLESNGALHSGFSSD